LKVLKKYANFTHIGNEIMEEVNYVMLLTNKLIRDLNVDSNIILFSKNKVVKHFNNVKTKYSNLQY